MVRTLKILLVVALTAFLVTGLATTTGCDVNPGDNGNITNGDVPNGNEPNGNEPNSSEPDLISGPGVIIDCDENTGSSFAAGDPAPDFRFQDAAGATFSLSDFQGKSVMLNFWKTTCGWCVVELPYIQQVYDEWQDEELVILTIDLGESADKVNDFLDGLGVSLPVLLDGEGKTMLSYQISSIPRTFFIDKEGLIRGIKFGALQSKEELEDILEQLIAL